jgi:hypothetical protein
MLFPRSYRRKTFRLSQPSGGCFLVTVRLTVSTGRNYGTSESCNVDKRYVFGRFFGKPSLLGCWQS